MQRKIALSCLMLAVLGTLSCAASAAPTYTVTPAGNLGGSNTDDGFFLGGLNNSGQIAGYSYTSSGVTHAYVSSGGKATDLNPPGASGSRANAINDAGTVVGQVNDSQGNDRAAVFQNGSVTYLGSLGGMGSYAYGINNAGTVVGSSYLASQSTFHAYVTENGKLVDIGTLAGADGFSEAYAINDQGLVVGYSETADRGLHAFSYLNGKMTDLGTPDGTVYSQAQAVNASGAIVGYSYASDLLSVHSFLYANGTMIDLGTMGANRSFAYDINDAGDVVGELDTDDANGNRIDRNAFLYSGGKTVDLNSLIDPAAGWDLQWAGGINNNGQISALGCNASGFCEDVLLTRIDAETPPTTSVPEPEAFTAGIAGLALFGLLRRRKAAR
jgi:probable HAF family extracellular repeat protein